MEIYEENKIVWEQERRKLADARIKNRELFVCALDWLRLLERGANLLPYFKERDCRRIGIYGAGELAEVLIQELIKKNEVEIVYLMDQSAAAQREKYGFPVYLPEELHTVEDVDMIVVTAITYYDSISERLIRMRPEIPVVSLKNIIKDRISEEYYVQG